MTCGIYAIRNKQTGERYVGQAVDINKRWVEHTRELGGGSVGSPKLQAAWQKYGPEAFEFVILEECARNLLDDREGFYMRQGCEYNRQTPMPVLSVNFDAVINSAPEEVLREIVDADDDRAEEPV